MKIDEQSHYPINTPIGIVSVYYQNIPFSISEISLPVWKTDAGPIYPLPARPLFPTDIAGLQQLVGLLSDYFEGKTIAPPWALLRMDGLTSLQQRVLRIVAAIPSGALKTYGDIAEAADCARAGRFVGNTMAKNPFPILIPCHRVVPRNGGIGGFGGGSDLKKRLIAFENKKT